MFSKKSEKRLFINLQIVLQTQKSTFMTSFGKHINNNLRTSVFCVAQQNVHHQYGVGAAFLAALLLCSSN